YLRALPGVDAKVRARHALERFDASSPASAERFVGQYLIEVDGRRTKVAVDAHDNRKIASRELLEWSDVYLKSNRWTRERYPSHVLPLVNGNGIHDARTLAYLTSLRRAPQAYDITFISRL